MTPAGSNYVKKENHKTTKRPQRGRTIRWLQKKQYHVIKKGFGIVDEKYLLKKVAGVITRKRQKNFSLECGFWGGETMSLFAPLMPNHCPTDL